MQRCACARGAREGRQGLQQEDVPRTGTPSYAQQQGYLTCSKAVCLDNPHPGGDKGAVSGSPGKAPEGSLPTPAEAPAVGPCLGASRASAGAPRRRTRYHSRMTAATVSVKVCMVHLLVPCQSPAPSQPVPAIRDTGCFTPCAAVRLGGTHSSKVQPTKHGPGDALCDR